MNRGVYPRTWIGALVAFYLVMVFPACWYGALSEARALGLAAPSSSNNNEEREEHEERDSGEHEALGRQPPPPPLPGAAATSVARVRTTITPTLIALISVAPVQHPSLFSERRLI